MEVGVKAVYAAIDKLEEDWAKCKKCRLHANRDKMVFWRGSPEANIMLIGEAPGRNEDAKGSPFIGQSGNIIDEFSEAAGLKSNEDLFITNLVCCRPPQNRDPKPDEVKECWPRLEGMIRIVNPKVLLVVGAPAARRLAGVIRISDWVGEKTEVELGWGEERLVIPAVCMYHPAYYLRKRQKWLRNMMVDCFKKVKEVADAQL